MPAESPGSAGRYLQKGAFNVVSAIKGGKLVARRTIPGEEISISSEELEGEAALTTLASLLGIHPKLRGLNITAKGRGPGRSTMIMQRGIDVAEWLEDDLGTKDEGKRVADDLLRMLCTISDLGFCLFDLKPNNSIIVDGVLKLIDFDPRFAIYMDGVLLTKMMRIRPLGACAAVRGFSLFLMILQWYFMLKKRIDGRTDDHKLGRSLRLRSMFAVLKSKLETAKMPLTVLLTLENSVLGRRLAEAARHYRYGGEFKMKSNEYASILHELYSRITNEMPDVSDNSNVRILDTDFVSETSSCSTSGRSSVVSLFRGRTYPCNELNQIAISAFQIIGQHVGVLKGTGVLEGPLPLKIAVPGVTTRLVSSSSKRKLRKQWQQIPPKKRPVPEPADTHLRAAQDKVSTPAKKRTLPRVAVTTETQEQEEVVVTPTTQDQPARGPGRDSRGPANDAGNTAEEATSTRAPARADAQDGVQQGSNPSEEQETQAKRRRTLSAEEGQGNTAVASPRAQEATGRGHGNTSDGRKSEQATKPHFLQSMTMSLFNGMRELPGAATAHLGRAMGMR